MKIRLTALKELAMKHFALLTIFFFMAVLSGCMDDTNAQAPQPEAEFIAEESGQYIESGTFTGKQIKVIGDQQAYATELAQYTSSEPKPLDFSQGQVLLVDMGQRNSGGYSIDVTSVDVFDDYVMANVTLTKPGKGCIVTMALTNPYQFVYIPTRKEILVTESLTINDCAP